MMILQTLLMLAVTLLICSGARLPRQSSPGDDDEECALPNTDTCGHSGIPYKKKIVSGGPADAEQFPWMAALGYVNKTSTTVQWNCAGSLITNRHVLTAAHCVHTNFLTSNNLDLVKIRLGELNLDESVKDKSEPQDIDVDRNNSCILHEHYKYRSSINDIAIVIMKTKVTFTDFIRPICLPREEFVTNDFTGFSPQVAGWGSTSFEGPRNPHLQVADVVIQDIDECRRNITSIFPNAIIDSRVICASAEGVDSCQGDSGGPLMMARTVEASSSGPRSTKYFLMGIVSYGYQCAREGYPGVYVRVSTYLRWIVEHLDI